MNNDGVVARLCGLPNEFKTRGNVSMFQLISEAGYLTVADQVHEVDIENYLRKHSELIDTWLGYSNDQRCTPAWYFVPGKVGGEPTDSGWRVGYYVNARTERSERCFQDACSACAYFVKQFAESLRVMRA